MLAINYIGQCGFYIFTEDIAIAIDPVLNDMVDERGKSIRNYPPVIAYEDLDVDYIFCTHEHIDHMAIETLLGVAKIYENVKFVIPKGCVSLLTESGINEKNIIGLSDGEKIHLADCDIDVQGISTAHPVHQKDENGMDRNLAYCITMEGKKLVHLGDTYMTEQLRNALDSLGKIDVLMPPVNGRDEERESRGIIGNLSCKEAAELAMHLKAELSIPTHFDMVAGNTANPFEFFDVLKDIAPELDCWIPTLREQRIL